MAAFHDFLTQLLGPGRIAFRSAKAPDDRPAEPDLTLLAESFATHALTVAGPPIASLCRIGNRDGFFKMRGGAHGDADRVCQQTDQCA